MAEAAVLNLQFEICLWLRPPGRAMPLRFPAGPRRRNSYSASLGVAGEPGEGSGFSKQGWFARYFFKSSGVSVSRPSISYTLTTAWSTI